MKVQPLCEGCLDSSATTSPASRRSFCVDYGVTGRWAESKGITYTSYQGICRKEPRVLELVQRAIEQVNQTLPVSARVRRFVNLFKELDADDNELTDQEITPRVPRERYKDI